MYEKQIDFIKWPDAENNIEPVAAKEMIPQWYRDGEYTFSVKKAGQSHPVGFTGAGMKACIPFLDVLISGYFLLTTTDIHVENKNNELNITFDEHVKHQPVDIRPEELGNTIPVPAGHNPAHLVWSPAWGWKTPKGYSSLVIHPFNRFDLPFTTLSAIVDSDKYNGAGNIPFFIKENFNGTIEKGTPFAQIVPIKRNRWKGKNNTSLIDETIMSGEVIRMFDSFYKKYLHIKKDYGVKK